jgi:hypothetical protein
MKSSPVSCHSRPREATPICGVSALPVSAFVQAGSADRGGSASEPAQFVVSIYRLFTRYIPTLHVRALIGYSPTRPGR